MERKNKEEWLKIVDCPHQLQDFVGCNDESAKALAELVYEFAMDDKLRESFRRGDMRFAPKSTLGLLAKFLSEFDVYPYPSNDGLALLRYERPPIGDEKKGFAGFSKYLQSAPNVKAYLPCYVSDVIRAFGEFVGKEVDPDIVARCTGIFDHPNFPCPICGKYWEKIWDE